MSESKPITVRLDESYAKELERLATEQNTSSGLLAKRFLTTAIDTGLSAGETSKSPLDASRLAAEIAEQLRSIWQAGRDEATEELCVLTRELIRVVTGESQTTRKELSHLRQDLAALAALLEDTESEEIDKRGDGNAESLLRFEE